MSPNLANASRNPKAQDCGRITDGAAAIVLASPRYAAAHVGLNVGGRCTTVVSFIVGR